MHTHLLRDPHLVATPWLWSTVEATMYVGPGLLVAAEVHEMHENDLDTGMWSDEPDEPNLLHQRYHLFRWEQAAQRKVADLHRIVEFGGGYGAMAVVCSRLGFRGDYYMMDIPEFQAVQMAHLPTRNVRSRLHWEGHHRPDLFLSAFGISETTIEGRDTFLNSIEPMDFLIAFQGSWFGIDNRAWFASWAQANARAWKLEPGPIGSSNLYLTTVHR